MLNAKGVGNIPEICYKNNEIILNQESGSTIYNVLDKTIDGEVNDVSEDLRDYLRRRGIKIFADRFLNQYEFLSSYYTLFSCFIRYYRMDCSWLWIKLSSYLFIKLKNVNILIPFKLNKYNYTIILLNV